MKLTHIRILNFRSCHSVELELDSMHALVGANNAGKSTVLRALDFLLSPSTRKLNEDSFWNRDTGLEIRVEAEFTHLSDEEKDDLKGYLIGDDRFVMARTAKFTSPDDAKPLADDDSENKIKIGQQYKLLSPVLDWLQEEKVNGENIAAWWQTKDGLEVSGKLFCEGWSKKPAVGEWKARIGEFITKNHAVVAKEEKWIDNPKGYANVLKGVLPFFVIVPAVRDIADESKGTKTSPFGKLLSVIVQSVAEEKKKKIEQLLTQVSDQMNRSGGEERVALISDTEKELNQLLGDVFPSCDLEIEFETPTLEILLSTPKLFVDDGFRNTAENKGHGLQRAIIFTILRRYAEFMASGGGKKRNLILAVEEPELYMHPQAQRTIRKVFRKIAMNGDQVFFSTHSSLLVDVAYFDEIIRMENNISGSGEFRSVESNAWQLPMGRMIEDLTTRIPSLAGKATDESMRELYSHVYNPRRNEGFFASKIILVEGLTEEYCLPIYADSIPNYSLDPLGISVVECGGKGPMDRLYRIFNDLRIPCFMLFDYDHGNSDKEIIAKSDELLALVGLSKDEKDELFVSSNVAYFRTKWETVLSPQIPNHDSLVAKARKELGLSADTGKPLVARYVAKALCQNDPPTIPPSIKQILDRATKVSWAGSCLKRKSEAQIAEGGVA